MTRIPKLPRAVESDLGQRVNNSEIQFQCNICGHMNFGVDPSLFGREDASCEQCASTVRMRAIIHLLSSAVFGKSMTIAEFPERSDLKGIGMSDWDGYAVPIAKKFDYANTYYHQEPRLDITDIEDSRRGTLDFIISSDVYEHVEPPVSRAFINTLALLKPGGVFIFTVPFTTDNDTVEHFPDLFHYEIKQVGDTYILENETRDGAKQRFSDLVFHGGPGSTLEMRVFSEKSVLRELQGAGFSEVTVHREAYARFGIFWRCDWSLPITARR